MNNILSDRKIDVVGNKILNKPFPKNYGEENKLYTPEIYDRHGIGLLISILDYEELNPYSLVFNGPFKTVCEMRKFIANKLLQDEDRFRNNVLLKDLAKEITFQKKFTPLYEKFMINKSVRYNSKIGLQDRRANQKKPTSNQHLSGNILDLRNYENYYNVSNLKDVKKHPNSDNMIEKFEKIELLSASSKRNASKLKTVNAPIINKNLKNLGTIENKGNSSTNSTNNNDIETNDKMRSSRTGGFFFPKIDSIINNTKIRNKSGKTIIAISANSQLKSLSSVESRFNTSLKINSNKYLKEFKELDEINTKVNENIKLTRLYKDVKSINTKNNTLTNSSNKVESLNSNKKVVLKGNYAKLEYKLESSKDINKNLNLDNPIQDYSSKNGRIIKAKIEYKSINRNISNNNIGVVEFKHKSKSMSRK